MSKLRLGFICLVLLTFSMMNQNVQANTFMGFALYEALAWPCRHFSDGDHKAARLCRQENCRMTNAMQLTPSGKGNFMVTFPKTLLQLVHSGATAVYLHELIHEIQAATPQNPFQLYESTLQYSDGDPELALSRLAVL